MVAAHPSRARTTKAVIVGGGPAGDAVAAGLRDAKFQGAIVLIGAERELPYERPHLSKGYLAGTVARARLGLRPPLQYRQLEVDLELGKRVLDIGLDDHRAILDDGNTIGWDILCLAAGSGSRRLPGLEPAPYLRELVQADRLKAVIERKQALEIIGAGFIGCEVAAVARQRGIDVRVHEALSQPLVRVLGEDLGAYIAQLHRERGVDLRLNAPTPQSADLVAVGSVPRTELAQQAGLAVDQGVVVDELGRTSVPGVFAAGDVTRFHSPHYETRIRVEHFQTAQRQGFAVGRAMAGAEEAFSEVPWFWSDQYDVNLQYAGAGLAWDETVTRGELGKPPFTVFYLRAGAPIAAAGVNDHHTVARARRLMEARKKVTAQQLSDPGFDLRRALA